VSARPASPRAALERRREVVRPALERRGSTTFTPIADLLRELTGSGVAEDIALRRRTPEATGWRRCSPRSSVTATSRSTEESFWAVRRLLELSPRRPVMVVVDDIQWAEPLFWDLLDHLVEWTEAPVLLSRWPAPSCATCAPN
jgi:hypothetical protein